MLEHTGPRSTAQVVLVTNASGLRLSVQGEDKPVHSTLINISSPYQFQNRHISNRVVFVEASKRLTEKEEDNIMLIT